MAGEFADLLGREIEAALGRPPWERLELVTIEPEDHAAGAWPTAIVCLRDPHRPKFRFGHRASAELPGGDPADAGWLPTAASLAAIEVLEGVLTVLRAPSATADADGVIWF